MRFPFGTTVAGLFCAIILFVMTPGRANARYYRDGDYTGPAFSAYYGYLQVQVVIRGGRIAAVNVPRYPSDRSTSRRIAARAVPELKREAIRSQSAAVHVVSGATLDSRAFQRSLAAALRKSVA